MDRRAAYPGQTGKFSKCPCPDVDTGSRCGESREGGEEASRCDSSGEATSDYEGYGVCEAYKGYEGYEDYEGDEGNEGDTSRNKGGHSTAAAETQGCVAVLWQGCAGWRRPKEEAGAGARCPTCPHLMRRRPLHISRLRAGLGAGQDTYPIYKIKGVGDVLAGRVEQGVVKPGEEVVFLPTHTASNPCVGKVFTVEMHHQRVDFAGPGDNVGLNIKGLDKGNMPRSGDVMVYKKDTTLGQTKEFNAQIQVLDIPNEIKTGYSPIGFVRCGRSACRISKLVWKMGKETGGKKMEDPHSLKSNEMAECSFQPQQPLVCDSFKNCEGLSRVAFMDGNGVVMLGKVTTVEQKSEADGGKKK